MVYWLIDKEWRFWAISWELKEIRPWNHTLLPKCDHFEFIGGFGLYISFGSRDIAILKFRALWAQKGGSPR